MQGPLSFFILLLISMFLVEEQENTEVSTNVSSLTGNL